MYVSVEQIKEEYKLKPQNFGFNDVDATEKLDIIIERWILQAMGAIDNYLNISTSYSDEDTPAIVSLACTEVVGNIITNRRIREDGNYIKSNDWTKEIVAPMDILDGVRELLEPLIVNEEYDNSEVNFFAVTGQKVKEDES